MPLALPEPPVVISRSAALPPAVLRPPASSPFTFLRVYQHQVQVLRATRPISKSRPHSLSPFPGHLCVPGTALSLKMPALSAAIHSALFLPCLSHLLAGHQSKGGCSLLLHSTSLSFLKAFKEVCWKRFGIPGTACQPGCPALWVTDPLRGAHRVVRHNSAQLLTFTHESPQSSPGYRS